MNNKLYIISAFMLLFSCQQAVDNNTEENKSQENISQKTQVKTDKLIHYSALDAMRNGVYTGDLTIGEAKKNGDFGLGTYNQLDGEMIVLGGVFYQIKTNGEVFIANDEEKTPFNGLAFFNTDFEISSNAKTFKALTKDILSKLPSKNQAYAIMIQAEMEDIELGGSKKVDKNDHRPVGEILKTRPIYKHKNVKGTFIGFYYPTYLSNIDLHPFHFHFISDDKRIAGHAVKANLKSVKISIDKKESVEVVMPNTQDFNADWKSTSANQSKSGY